MNGQAPQRFVAGAIDLGEVKSRAEARNRQPAGSADPAARVAAVVEVTEATIQSEVIERSLQVPVVVHVGTSRSPESEDMREILARLAQSQQDISWIYAYLDADTSPQLAQALGIQALPTVLALAQGQPLADFQGGQPEEALQQWTAAVVQAVAGKLEGLPAQGEPAEDPRLAQARDYLAANNAEAALELCRAITADDPTHAEAAQLTRRAELQLRNIEANTSSADAATSDEPIDAAALLAASDGVVDVQSFEHAADTLMGRDDVEQSFAVLIEGVRHATGEAKTALRTRLLEMFEMFEPTDPRVLTARAALASALY